MLFLHASKMSGPQIAVPLPVAANVVASGSGCSSSFRAAYVAAERAVRPSVVRPSVIAAAKFATVKGKIHPSPAPLLAWQCMHALKCSGGRPTDGPN